VSARDLRHSTEPELLFELARGGMGKVELAVVRQGPFTRVVAVKRLLDEIGDDSAAAEAFIAEARYAGLIRHANVVAVQAVGTDELGPYIVMEYVASVSVAELVRVASTRGVRLPVQLCCRIVAQAAHGLHAAHEARDVEGRPLMLVHRDVSPQNLLVGYDGIVKVTDFGVAKAIEHADGGRTATLRGRVGYAAPERLLYRDYDRRADLFSLGVTLFELLSGTRLYGEGERAARRVLDEPAPDLGDIRPEAPLELVELLFEMLAKNPFDRPETAHAVAMRLDSIVAALTVEEGSIDVGEIVNRHVGEQRRHLEDRITLALAARDAPGDGSESAPRSRTRARHKNRRALVPWFIGTAALVFGGSAALWSATRSSAVTPLSPARTPSSVASSSAAVVPPPAVTPTAAAERPVPASKTPAATPRPRPAARPRADVTQPDCADPFYLDSEGRKRVKRGCFR
jgi:serine/threonine-protein kinase